jgi:hypothetical protein
MGESRRAEKQRMGWYVGLVRERKLDAGWRT